ncbi:MAG: hypothetical protein ABJH07_11845 [Sedimentitalea sp.]|uniref:hypothetical protein n=1 Tax=Sedimentitalea sp. TaxID=2048915 RepID=UPI003262DDCB
MAADFIFERNARTTRMAILLTLIYVVLIAAVVVLDAAISLVGGLALLTLPALWDFYQNTAAGLCLSDRALQWHSGRRRGELELDEIDHMRFDTRWDLSVRVRAVLHNKKRVQLPFEATPPHRAFEKALEMRGIRVRRNHFAFF